MEKLTALKIIFENDNYLVIDKPAGLIVHGGSGIKEKTLVDQLISYLPNITTIGEDSARPGIVHRLDKDVSGLMVIAKTNESFLSLKKQFKNRDVNKNYLALVHGKINNDEGEIDFPIKRASRGFKMAAIPVNTFDLLSRSHPTNRDQGNIDGAFKAREALTKFSVKQRFVNYTLVNVTIVSGRTHQIRVHFLALGHPLLGDNLYYNKKSKQQNKKINLGRIFLVANSLKFKDLNGDWHEFSLELPLELEEVLKVIK